jgi:hypothetical protein
VVELDGTLRMAISNKHRLLRHCEGERISGAGRGMTAGMRFYNDEGPRTLV